jgi:hypothetical protein
MHGLAPVEPECSRVDLLRLRLSLIMMRTTTRLVVVLRRATA